MRILVLAFLFFPHIIFAQFQISNTKKGNKFIPLMKQNAILNR